MTRSNQAYPAHAIAVRLPHGANTLAIAAELASGALGPTRPTVAVVSVGVLRNTGPDAFLL